VIEALAETNWGGEGYQNGFLEWDEGWAKKLAEALLTELDCHNLLKGQFLR
jgi:hypothetical protein